ncbi:MAG: glycosyltransferase family 2 protein, partial [Actinobacteria bacterium]|nr:glycosyltransferase family 2 protein [Actinomycetota bacterium]
APLMAGHTGIAVGTRLAPGAHVQRGPERELASRTYNAILHTVLGTTFSDARCGCKALRRDLATILLPMVVDTGRFFDTELLLLAQHNDLRIHEVPVDWADDRDCPADLARTAAADVRGITRLVRTFARGGGRLDRTLIPDGCARSASHVPPIPERIHG